MNNDDLPRNQIPGLFHPHRTEFTCRHELTTAPPRDAQAEIWFQEALALDTPDIWKDQRDWRRIVELYTKAAERKHWKAMNNLATLYQTGVRGLLNPDKVLVERDANAAMALTEEAMRMGVPFAYAVMGNYYADGFIVKHDPTAAWAFWQKAADMGSSYAQFTIGRSLNAVLEKDAPERSRWSNAVIGLKMLECAFAQGNGDAAYELALEAELVNKDRPRALHYLHEGVKFGSARSARALRIAFEKINGLSPHGIDRARADRYDVLGDALEHNPDLRFPNLDRVLPLPPARLPQWNSKPEDLINAAKPVVPAAPPQKATPGANLSGRFHIPQGYVLPEVAIAPGIETGGGEQVTEQYESTTARFSGYWLPQLLKQRTQLDVLWDHRQTPQRYERGEPFANLRDQLSADSGRIMWCYMGIPEQLPAPTVIAQVRSGMYRIARNRTAALTRCSGDEPCPQIGIWQPRMLADQPLQALVNVRWRQAARGALSRSAQRLAARCGCACSHMGAGGAGLRVMLPSFRLLIL